MSIFKRKPAAIAASVEGKRKARILAARVTYQAWPTLNPVEAQLFTFKKWYRRFGWGRKIV